MHRLVRVLIWSLLWLPVFFETAAGKPEIRFRADHLVLEAVTDNTYVFAATQNGKINCFNLKSGEKEKDLLALKPRIKNSYPPAVYSLDLSPSKKLLAAGTGTGQIFLFSTGSRRIVSRVPIEGVENVPSVRFLDENRVVVGLMDGTLRLVQWRNGREIYRTKIELDPINNIRLSENRALMAVSTAASSIKIVSTVDGKIQQELDAHKDTVYALAFLSPGRLLTGSKDMTLRQWDLSTGSSTVIYKSQFYINSVAWDGRGRIAFHLPDYNIGIMDLASKRILQVLEGHTAFINTLFFITPDRLLSSGNDARIFIHAI